MAVGDGSAAGGATDGAEDGQGCAGSDATGPCDDDDGDCGAGVAGEEEGQSGAAEGEVDEVTGKPVCGLLDGCAGALGAFYGFDNLSECGVPPDAGCADLKEARLVDGAGVDLTPR